MSHSEHQPGTAPRLRPTRREAALSLAAGTVLGFSRSRPAGAAAGEVIQTVRLRFDPEQEQEALALVAELTAAVKANEPGVLTYLVHRSEVTPTELFFYEVYADEQAFADHGKQAHLDQLRNALGSIFLLPLTIERLSKIGGYSR